MTASAAKAGFEQASCHTLITPANVDGIHTSAVMTAMSKGIG